MREVIIFDDKEETDYEESKDDCETIIKGCSMQHGMRRMSDFLPVSMQDFLHGCEPEVRKYQKKIIQVLR